MESWTSLVGGGLVAGPDDRDRGQEAINSASRRPGEAQSNASDAETREHRPLLINGIPADQLLAELRGGSRAALEVWYRALHDPLWRMAVVLTRSREQAEEIVQDVFLALWRNRESVSSDVRAYLYASVRHAARERRRQDQMVAQLHDRIAHGYIDPPALGRSEMNSASRADAGDFYDVYRDALTTLTEREALAFRLRLEEELTFEQIGELLGLSKVGARKMILRAEEKIRALLSNFRDFRR
jgi:RNA polymerase sigma-70 factor (ECF subfamily)